MANKYSDICYFCGHDESLKFGSDGVWCSDCGNLESWNSYHRRIKEIKDNWDKTVNYVERLGKGQGF